MKVLPFTVRRRISWGDCDPARIYYTPRAADYAVEAVEAWYKAVLEVSWADLVGEYGLDAPFVQIACDYRLPLVASQVIHLKVWVEQLERSSITFCVAGEGEGGNFYFLAHLKEGFVERKNSTSTPIPAEFWQKIENYKDQFSDVPEVLDDSHRSGHSVRSLTDGAGTVDSYQYCLSAGELPFSRQRRVVYGDCDASGKTYAPRVFSYAIETIEEWFEEVPGVSWMDLVYKREQGAPFVSVSCEYLRHMLPAQLIRIVVWVTRLGRASIGFAVTGYDDNGAICFTAHLSACFIDRKVFKAIRIPEVFRQRIQAYQAACETFDL